MAEQYGRGNATSQPSPAALELFDTHLRNLAANFASSSPEALFGAHLDLAASLALTVHTDYLDIVKRCVAPIGGFGHWHVSCNCVRSPSRLFCSDRGYITIHHKRHGAKTARAGTAVLFDHWRVIKCPITAYKLVQSFVVDASRKVLTYTDASEHVRSTTAKRSGCEAPETSDAGSKRQKTDTDVIMIDDDPESDSEKRQKTDTEVAAAWNDPSGTWSCGACTYVNDKLLAPACAICGSIRAGT